MMHFRVFSLGQVYCFWLLKGVRALMGYFGPLYSQKMKVAFHQFHLIDLLEEKPKCKILAFILLLPVAMVTKMADKIGLK